MFHEHAERLAHQVVAPLHHPRHRGGAIALGLDRELGRRHRRERLDELEADRHVRRLVRTAPWRLALGDGHPPLPDLLVALPP